MQKLYPKLFREFARVTRTDGLILCLALSKSLMKGVVSFACDIHGVLRLEWTRAVDSGYLVTLYAFRRTAASIPWVDS